MKSLKFSYLKLGVVVAALAIALVPSLQSSTAKNSPLPDTANFANEEQVITRYVGDLITYEVQAEELGKKARVLSADLDPLQRKSDDLKGRLSGVQNALREILRKLRAANELDDLDTRVAARITDARKKKFFQDSSLKQGLLDFSNNLDANEISIPVNDLRKKLTSRYSSGADVQFVHAAYAAPAPFARVGLGCRLGRLGLKITVAVGKDPSKEQANRVFNRCYPDGIIDDIF